MSVYFGVKLQQSYDTEYNATFQSQKFPVNVVSYNKT